MFENEVKYRVVKAALKSLYYGGTLSKDEYKNKMLEIQDVFQPEFLELEDWDVEEMLLGEILE